MTQKPMTKQQWELLNRIVFDVARTLQDGKHSTWEEWQEIADELKRAADIAQNESDYLSMFEKD